LSKPTVSRLRDVGIIPIIRASSADVVVPVAEALLQAGLPVVEITMTVPNAIDAIGAVAKRFGGKVLVGAGTVTDAETARRAVDAGAVFIVTPCLVPEVIEAARNANVAVLPGALTPTEVFDAHRAGGDMVKVFPVQSVGGAAYLRALRGPFPDIPLVPTGGVNLQTAADFLKAGCAALGVGGSLLTAEILRTDNWPELTRLARAFVEIAGSARLPTITGCTNSTATCRASVLDVPVPKTTSLPPWWKRTAMAWQAAATVPACPANSSTEAARRSKSLATSLSPTPADGAALISSRSCPLSSLAPQGPAAPGHPPWLTSPGPGSARPRAGPRSSVVAS